MADESQGKFLVAFTTWETDRLPGQWLEILGRYDLVLVPSRFNADVFASSGLTVLIAVVPHIARPVRTPQPGVPTRTEDSRYVVYVVATWTTRKAILDSVDAFVTAFGADDDVVLVIHTLRTSWQRPARPQGSFHEADKKAPAGSPWPVRLPGVLTCPTSS